MPTQNRVRPLIKMVIVATAISALIVLYKGEFPPGMVLVATVLGLIYGLRRTNRSGSTKAFRELKSTHAASSKESQRQIDFLAHHDSLTGLPARSIARDRFERMMSTADRGSSCCALLLIDLDNFKAVNETAGNAAGDELLKHAALMLKQSVGQDITPCRWSGDEFLILIQDLDDPEEITSTIDRIMDDLKTPLVIGGVQLSATCSIGVAIFPADGSSFDTILRGADSAMQQAKDAGRNGFCFFDPSLNSSENKNFHLITDLRNSVLNNELVLHYQPQFDLISGALIGAEALVRWNHPIEGLLPPSAFIHLAEASGFINELGGWVLRQACMQCAEWRAAGTSLVMSVNISPMQFRRKDLDEVIIRALEASKIPPECLDMELTEGLFVDDTQEMSDTLCRIRNLGVLMSIDDFGTGYSNLSYLRRLPVQQIKIDQTFVRSLDGDNTSLVRAIVQIADTFNLGTIAEGVEDLGTLNALIALGCKRGQGYYWDRPLPLDQFAAKYIGQHHLQVPKALYG